MSYKEIVKSIDEIDPLVRLSLIDLSNSRIETIYGDWGCEAKYFYNYVVKEKDPGNPAALLGNVIHQVLENLLDNDKELNLKELTDEYRAQLEAYDSAETINGDLRQLGYVMIEDFFETEKDVKFTKKKVEPKQETKEIISKEMGFNIVIGRANVRGFIDRVDLSGDRVEIVDYKSGKHEYPLKHIAKNLQLGLYALAMKKMFPDKDVHASLYYLRSGNKKGHLFTDGDLDRVVETVLDVTDKISSITNFSTTANKRICKYCPHAASGICSTGKAVLRPY